MQEISKGQKISLNKITDSKNITIDINYNSPSDYEIDTSVLMLSESGKLENEEEFIFYNNPISKCNSVEIKDFQGIKKRININFDKIPSDISRLMFVCTIDSGDIQNKRFINVSNLNINVSDNNNSILNYSVTGLEKETAVILIEIYKHNNEWKLQATGNGFNSGLDAIINEYGSESVKVQDNNSQQIQDKKIEIKQEQPKQEIKSGVTLSKTPAGSIDFVKKHNERFDLVKKEVAVMGLEQQKANVVLVMDVSWSMSQLFDKGHIQDTFDRVLPLAMQFDDDGSIEVWLFDDRCIHSDTPYTLQNREGYVKKSIVDKYKLGGGTMYANVIKQITTEFANTKKITYVLFFTDGDCFDAKETEKAMISASDKPLFWKFIGLGGNKPKTQNDTSEKKGLFGKVFTKSGTGFNFLEKLDDLSGRVIDNADFFQIYKINEMNDSDLYKGLLQELPEWIKEASSKGII